MSATQWCPACAEIPGYYEANANGAWVDIQGHEHELPPPRPSVYLYEPAHDDQPAKWAAHLWIWLDEPVNDHLWAAWREFDTLPDAMEYARLLVAQPSER